MNAFLFFKLRHSLVLLSVIAISLAQAEPVSCVHVVENLVIKKDPWYEVVVPTDEGFHYHKVKRKTEVQRLLREKSPEMEAYMDALFEKSQDQFRIIVKFLRPIAQKFQAKLEYRLKDSVSLRNKIISRAKSYHESGRIFTVEDLHDMIGTRLIVPHDSHLAAMGSYKPSWAKHLGIKPEQILDIEMKGRPEECAKGRCYRATHIALLHESGVHWEIQILTRGMYWWSKWDHPRVYKTTHTDPVYVESLKTYSRNWVKMIRALEDRAVLNLSNEHIDQLMQQVGVSVDLNARDWLMMWDAELIKNLSILPEDQFLSFQSYTGLNDLKSLSRKP